MVVSPDVVEDRLAAGGLECRPCGHVLGPWGFARQRRVRGLAEPIRPRRGRCRECGVTQVLLPATVLVRRADCVEVIGKALELAGGGAGFRALAVLLGVPPDTVRGWLRRARANAAAMIARAARWSGWLDPSAVLGRGPATVLGALVDAVGHLGAAAVRRGGTGLRATSPWALVAVITDGHLLAVRLEPG